jgi:AcrR family transcriptional regulator
MPQKARLIKEADAADTKKQILDAALNLFTVQGFDATPTSQISKEANVSTGTTFYYFPSKNAILEQLYLSIKKELGISVKQKDNTALPTKERLLTCIKNYVEWASENPKKSLFLDQFYHSANISQKVKQEALDEFDWIKDIVETALQEGVLKDFPLRFHLVMIGSIINGLVVLSKSAKSESAKEQLIKAGLGLLLKD